MEGITVPEAVFMRDYARIRLCKNANMVITPDEDNPPFCHVDNLGCENLRRHSSAYCQECSDKHNKA